MDVYLVLQVREGFDQIGFTGAEVAINSAHPMVIQSHLLKITRPQIEPDVNYAHADVSFPKNRYWKSRIVSCRRHLLLETYFVSPTFIVPLDASGGRVFRNLIRPLMLD